MTGRVEVNWWAALAVFCAVVAVKPDGRPLALALFAGGAWLLWRTRRHRGGGGDPQVRRLFAATAAIVGLPLHQEVVQTRIDRRSGQQHHRSHHRPVDPRPWVRLDREDGQLVGARIAWPPSWRSAEPTARERLHRQVAAVLGFDVQADWATEAGRAVTFRRAPEQVPLPDLVAFPPRLAAPQRSLRWYEVADGVRSAEHGTVLVTWDLRAAPHLLVAGVTRRGKSALVRVLLAQILSSGARRGPRSQGGRRVRLARRTRRGRRRRARR